MHGISCILKLMWSWLFNIESCRREWVCQQVAAINVLTTIQFSLFIVIIILLFFKSTKPKISWSWVFIQNSHTTLNNDVNDVHPFDSSSFEPTWHRSSSSPRNSSYFREFIAIVRISPEHFTPCAEMATKTYTKADVKVSKDAIGICMPYTSINCLHGEHPITQNIIF